MENILYPLGGGMLIGLGSSVLFMGIGKIAGISGILGLTLKKPVLESLWRYAFVIGLIGGGLIIKLLNPELFEYEFKFNALDYIIGGLLVGFGTRLGSGCTSGHGVCGISRMAKRSITATITFMFFGAIAVAIRGAL